MIGPYLSSLRIKQICYEEAINLLADEILPALR